MKKLLLIALSFGLATTAIAGDNFNEYLIKENITITNVKEKVTIKTKPNMFRSVIEFTDKDYSIDDAQLEVNKKIKAATAIIKKHDLKYQLGSFNTYKEYDSKKHVARQTITLDTTDKEKLEKVVTLLQHQKGLVKSTISYLSEDMKKKEFENLFTQAYTKAEKKAELISKALKAKNFSIMNVNYYMNERAIRPMMYAKATMMESAMASAPKIEMDNSEKEVWLELTLQVAVKR